MLTRKQQAKLREGIKKIKAEYLPEDEALFEDETPGPGLHKHDEDNPFGMHRHKLGEPMDGAHTHTPQNPGGEHVHGEFSGMALIDGKHYHKEGGLGYHHHHNKEDDDQIIPVQAEACEIYPDEFYGFTVAAKEVPKGRKLNKPFRTPKGPKKFSVFVKNDKGNIVKVNFGDPNMEIKRDDPKRRKNFRARHNCSNPGPKWKARYWSCKMWSSSPVSDLT